MTLQDTAPFARGAAGILTPVPGRSLEAELTHHALGDRVEEVLLVLHVVVQRHRLDAELAPDTSHRHRPEALTVHDGEGASTIRSRVSRSRVRVASVADVFTFQG
jgi:hypothetical protein